MRRKTNQMIKRILTFPISARCFLLLTILLRKSGLLRRPASARGSSVQRVFISHPYSSVGDLVLLLPLVERVRAEWPSAEIDVVVGSNACDLLDGVKGLHKVFVCGSQNARVRIAGYYFRFFRNLLFYRRQIMSFDYDLALAARWGSIMTSEAIYLAFLTGAGMRVGYAASVDQGDPGLDKLLTHVAVGGEGEHETIRNLRLLDRAGLAGPRNADDSVVSRPIQPLLNLVHASASEWERLSSIFKFSQSSSRYAVLSPGATRPFNRWPTERLAAVMRRLHELYSLKFYIVGGASDAPISEHLVQLAPAYAVSIAGATNLRQLSLLLARASLFLGMDSGTAHIAGGLGTPTVVVSPFPSSRRDEHPNSPGRFRPCGPRVCVLQPERALSPCDPTCSVREAHCILQITVEQVVQASAAFLEADNAENSSRILT